MNMVLHPHVSIVFLSNPPIAISNLPYCSSHRMEAAHLLFGVLRILGTLISGTGHGHMTVATFLAAPTSK
jgi:hypothetical protein